MSFNKVKNFFKRKNTDDTLVNTWGNIDENQENLNGGEEVYVQDNWNQDEVEEEIQDDQEENNLLEIDECDLFEKNNNFIYVLLLLLFIIFIPSFLIRIIMLIMYMCVYIDLFKLKLISVRLSKENYIKMDLDPFKILFSQHTINPKFQDGRLIETTIEGLISSDVKLNMINRIRVCIIDDKIHSLDNRRLYCF